MNATSYTTDASLPELLRGRGQRVTSQRLVIDAALRGLGRHASAEEVRASVADRLPGVSLPTVYATLELLEQLGRVRRVNVGGGPALWDPRSERHHHLACRVCRKVEDLEAGIDAAPVLEAATVAGFTPEGVELVVSGLCADCARL